MHHVAINTFMFIINGKVGNKRIDQHPIECYKIIVMHKNSKE